MPINHKACLPYKDTWAAPNSDLYRALDEKDFEKAKRIYERCEEICRRLERGEK
jgi:dihydrodipicolinate synthase/N-acetylneuraminate lyase